MARFTGRARVIGPSPFLGDIVLAEILSVNEHGFHSIGRSWGIQPPHDANLRIDEEFDFEGDTEDQFIRPLVVDPYIAPDGSWVAVLQLVEPSPHPNGLRAWLNNEPAPVRSTVDDLAESITNLLAAFVHQAELKGVLPAGVDETRKALLGRLTAMAGLADARGDEALRAFYNAARAVVASRGAR